MQLLIAYPLMTACFCRRPRSAPATPHADGHDAMRVEACRQWSSGQLLGGRQEIEITHAGCIYRLRLTSLGKLILTM